MKFKQHVPGFVSGIEPFTLEGSLQDLLEHPWIKKITEQPYFFRLVQNHEYYGAINPLLMLMVEMNEGKKWRVLGYINLDEGEKLDLPLWNGML